MKCPKCGAEVDKSKFCPECGTPLNQQVDELTSVETPSPNTQVPTYQNQPFPAQPQKKKSGCLKPALITLAALFGAFILLIIIVIAVGGTTDDDNTQSIASSSVSISSETSEEGNDETPSQISEPPAENSKEEPISENELQKLYASPANFKGRTVSLIGKVFSTPERDEKGVYFQMFAKPESSEYNTIVSYASPDFELADGDYVRVDGTVEGSFTGTNAFGGKITAPKVIASSVVKLSYADAIDPAVKVIESSEYVKNQLGYAVSVTKVEYGKKETRVYVTVKNDGAAKFNLYSFNAKIVQNGKQYEEQNNFYADYPDVQTDLLPGTTTEGIIAFPPLEVANFKIVLEGRSDDFYEDFEDYVFDIEVD